MSTRRQFITLLGGGAVSWPLAARAQQAVRIRRSVCAYAESDQEAQARVDAFRQGLRGLGWTKGHKGVSPASQPIGAAY